jgi:SSS family solute:Na+ symporter
MLAGIFGGGTLGLFLLGFLSRRATNRAALSGVAAGVVLILWMTLSSKGWLFPEEMRSHFHTFLTIVFGTAAILLTGLLVTTFLPGRPTSAGETKSSH